MSAVRTAVAVVLMSSVVGLESVRTQSPPRPLPAPEAFYKDVIANLTESDKEQYRYAYRERRSEVHTNPFGKLGTGALLLYDVAPGTELGLYHKRLLERDGKPVSEQKVETVDRRGRGTNPSINDVVATLDFRIRGRETIDGRDMIVVDFSPKKNASPKTRQGKIAKAFKGAALIDEVTREVVRVDATSIDTISYGGFIARLGEGTKATLERERVDSAVWLPTSIKLTGDGRALLFRKLNIDYVIEWFSYRRVLD
jgi:hypothetical protein